MSVVLVGKSSHFMASLIRWLRTFAAYRWRLLLLERLRPGETQRLLFLAALVGIAGALAAVAFRAGLEGIEAWLYGPRMELVEAAAGLPWWQRLLFPTIGGIAAGLVAGATQKYLTRTAGGDYMEAISLGDGRIGVRQSLAKALSSALSVTSGASIGREASMVQLSALAGSLLGRGQSLPGRRLMVACGAAAGITAAYNAPIAAALFVAEIVLRSIAIESLGPLLVAAVLANLTLHQFFDYGPVYQMPFLTGRPLGLEYLAFAGLGVLCGLLAPMFLGTMDLARRLFCRMRLPLWGKFGLGGLGVGVLSIFAPDVWGNGYATTNAILLDRWALTALAFVLLLKLLATACATGSGAIGGLFTPTLFAGAALGAIFGHFAHWILPQASQGVVYTCAGMGAFLAATTHAPLTAILMIFEMTENYRLILPLTLASIIAYTLARTLRERSVYASSLPTVTAPKFSALTARDLLRRDPPRLRRDLPLREVEAWFLRSRWQNLYVVDEVGRFLGGVSLHDFSPHLLAGPDLATPLPEALLRTDYPRVHGNTSLGQVLEEFSRHPGERLPVVNDVGYLDGYLTKTDLLLCLGADQAR